MSGILRSGQITSEALSGPLESLHVPLEKEQLPADSLGFQALFRVPGQLAGMDAENSRRLLGGAIRIADGVCQGGHAPVSVLIAGSIAK